VLRRLDNAALQFLLTATVRLIEAELPPGEVLGDVISLDTKHIIAWVKENNLKEHMRDRYLKERQPKGDPDCRLGCKERRNRLAPPEATPTTNPVPAAHLAVGQYYWGYASGVVATRLSDATEVVLAELTQPFDQNDATYFFPLMAQVEQRLGCRPRYGALDAAYDAFYVYDYFDQAGGFAAARASGGSPRTARRCVRPACRWRCAMPSSSAPATSPTRANAMPARGASRSRPARRVRSITPVGPAMAAQRRWPPAPGPACAIRLTAPARRTGRSTTSAPPSSASMPRRSIWTSSGRGCATAARSATRTRSSMC
jgi:hypothetical protein